MNHWIIGLITLVLSSHLFAVDLKTLNQKIKNDSAQWTAKSFQREFKMGLDEAPSPYVLFEDRTKALEKWDWRDVDGVNWLGSIMDQGNCGSCVAFASIATLEAQFKIAAGLSWLDPQFSTQQLFNCGGGACSVGWRLAPAAKMLKKEGVVDAACVPYESGVTGQDAWCKKMDCADKKNRITKIYDYQTPGSWGGSMAKLKEAIKKGPVVTGMTVYEDFLFYSSGIYKSVSKKMSGRHAVSIVGFNDVERFWVIRNSWGTEWGEKGFARISYDDKSGIGEDTYAFILKPDQQYIAVTTPENREFVSGEKSVVVNLTESSPGEIIIRGTGDFMKMDACDETGSKICQHSLDTTTLKDGRYEVFAQSNGKRSMIKEFFVVNNIPETTVTFKGGPGVDLSLAQKGRIEFDINVKSMPVMPKEMEMIIRNEKGEIVVTRQASEVYPEMRLGFRTNALPNGSYKIVFKTRIPVGPKVHETLSNTENLIILNE